MRSSNHEATTLMTGSISAPTHSKRANEKKDKEDGKDQEEKLRMKIRNDVGVYRDTSA